MKVISGGRLTFPGLFKPETKPITKIELRQLYKARAIMFQTNAADCHRYAAENMTRGFYNAAIYWQIASSDASRMARKCVERLNDGN